MKRWSGPASLGPVLLCLSAIVPEARSRRVWSRAPRSAHSETHLTSKDANASDEAWYVCAAEGEACSGCASGDVRYGDDAREEDSTQRPCPLLHRMLRDVCTNEKRPAENRPGPEIPDMSTDERGQSLFSVPPMASCEHVPVDAGTSAGAELGAAVKLFCDAGLGMLVEFYVDPEFSETFEKLKDADGWIPRAYVTYVALRHDGDRFGKEADLLVQSVHHFSKYPIVVANFGSRVPSIWTRKRFPNMVLVHGRPMIQGKSFNFNKLRAMMFTKVLTGIMVDADQWVNKGMDSMFRRTEEECTADYPFPIMPVHWLARDPQSDDGYPYTFNFKASDAPNRTMRWGHAHPTWTYHAYRFLAKWTSYVLKPERAGTPHWVAAQDWEDEDILNVGLWAENASKQWCKFDIPGYEDYQKYFAQGGGFFGNKEYPDTKWYPNGIAILFYSAHAAKEPMKTKDCLYDLFNMKEDRPRILYEGKWFHTGKELKAFDPSLRCMA